MPSLLFRINLLLRNAGRVEVIKDPLIDTLIARRPTITSKLTRSMGSAAGTGSSTTWRETVYGYRVQIFSGSSRQAAYNAQARFNAEYPGYRTYITYMEPNFKVHAGDFRSRFEAERLLQEVNQQFTSTFIMSEKINPPHVEVAKTEPAND